MASAVMEEDLTCSFCLNIYTDPVTLKCGHNFCRECIKTYLDTKERNQEEYSCPRCRKRFRRKPVPQKNTDLANIAEKVKTDQNKKCPEHNRILELYCTEHSTCICVLCMVKGEHRGHQVEMLEEASEKKKNKLRDDLQNLISEREKTEKRVQDLNNRREMVKRNREDKKGKSSALLRIIRKHLDNLENQIGREISKEEEQENPVFDLIRKLELKKDELSRKTERLEELNMADPITLLQERESDTDQDTALSCEETPDPDEFLISWRSRMLLSMMIHVGLSDILKMKDIYLPGQKPEGIVLDVNTAADNVQILYDRKTAVSTDVKQIRLNAANRFESSRVLSLNKFSLGQHCWMVEASTRGEWAVGMGYPSMSRRDGWIGENEKSWGIRRTGGSYQMLHKGESKLLSHTTSSNRLIVYLDYEAGHLSFCELSDPPNLLHTFTTTFTEPLHAVLQVKKNMTDNSHSQIRVI